jgi:Domain of unknown function (DUF3854)
MPSISILESPVGIPDHIHATHWQEWLDSGIAPQIIAANLTSLEGDLPFDRLCSSPGLARTNSGRLTTSVLKRYSHIEAGGWWCSGLDPERAWEPMSWGCFKPDHPRVDLERNKTIKYEHPLKTPTRAFFLLDPDHPTRWTEVQATADRPILIVEGAKKAAALISLGYDAIALPGVFNGRRVMRDSAGKIWSETLIPELSHFAQSGRPFYFCFDHDTKANTRHNVNLAIAATGRLLQKSGCIVSVITLPGPEKGVDDFIVARGSTAFAEAFTQAQTLNLWQWQWQKAQELKQPPSLSVHQAEFTPWQESTDIPDAGILVLASPKGTGKTKAIVERIHTSDRVIALGHRIALMRNLCDRMGLDYRSDLDEFKGQALNASGLTHRVGLCVDSLGRINPEEFRNGIVVIDEFMQVLRHLLLSETCNKDGRRAFLLARFQAVIQAAKLIILADADTADIGINYIRDLRNQPTAIYLIHNTYQPKNFPVKFLQDTREDLIIDQILKDLTAGKRIFIATDSIGTSEALEKVMNQAKNSKQGLLINSKTSSNPDQRAFITNPNQEISHYDWVIATPSLTTGVSIETPHIDVIYGLFYGVITDADASQALSRVRDNVPRIVWCAKQGKNFHKLSSSTKPNIIRDQLRTKIDMTAIMLRHSLGYSDLLNKELMEQLWQESPHIHTFAHLVAQTNNALWSLGDRLQARLESEGSQVTLETLKPEGDHTLPTIQLKDAKRQVKLDYQVAVATARILSKEEFQALQAKEALTPEDKLNIEKTQASEFLATQQLTSEDIAFYQEYRQAIPQLEALFYGTDFALAKDVATLNRQAQWGQGLLPFDMRFEALRQFVRDRLGLLPFLEVGRTWSNEDLEPLGRAVRGHRQNIKEILGFTVPTEEHANNGWLFQRLCRQLGLKVRSQRIGPRGKQKRFYTIDLNHYQAVITIIQRRHQRRFSNSPETSNSSIPLKNSLPQLVGTPIESIFTEGANYWFGNTLNYGLSEYRTTIYDNLSQKFQEAIDWIKKMPRPRRNPTLSPC